MKTKKHTKTKDDCALEQVHESMNRESNEIPLEKEAFLNPVSSFMVSPEPAIMIQSKPEYKPTRLQEFIDEFERPAREACIRLKDGDKDIDVNEEMEFEL